MFCCLANATARSNEVCLMAPEAICEAPTDSVRTLDWAKRTMPKKKVKKPIGNVCGGGRTRGGRRGGRAVAQELQEDGGHRLVRERPFLRGLCALRAGVAGEGRAQRCRLERL